MVHIQTSLLCIVLVSLQMLSLQQCQARAKMAGPQSELQLLKEQKTTLVAGLIRLEHLLSESGEREKELERRVEALTRENAELKTQLRQNEGKKEVEGLLWMLMERVGEAETGGARRHNEVLSKLEELVQVAEGGESREVSVVSRGKEGERQGRRKILKPLQSARKRVKGALAVALQRGEPEESTHDPPSIDAAQH